MDAKIRETAAAGVRGPTVTSPDRDAIASPPASGVASPLRWRFTLESMWERKLDEAIALSGACVGVSAAGDEVPGDGAALPSFRLYRRTARATDELAAIADAIERLDDGTYGVCTRCGEAMADEWLERDPAIWCCPGCSVPPARSAPTAAHIAPISSRSSRSNRL